MTKIRQKRFSNGKIQTQKKALTLKEVKNMSLADAYAIVGGYKQIHSDFSEKRILIYKHALEMVQKDDAQFAKLLQEDRAKPNPKVKKSLDITEAYNIVGGYISVDKRTFKQAIELLRADTTDPEFAALLIKFAESHSSFSDADDETLTKINEEGLAFFDNLDIKKVVENVLKDEEVQQAFNATPVAAKTETPKAEELINEIAQKGTIYSAATKAMEMPQSGNDENAFEEDVKKQTAAQIISLRLEEVNKDYDESVIEAIKSNSEKPLSAFRKKMKKAWDFTKKISISPESVKNVCDKAAAKWNKFTKKTSIATKTAIASTEYLIQELTPRNMKAACLAGVMSVSLFFSSCSNSGDTKTLTQEEIEAQRKAAEEKAKQDSISFAKAQKQAAIEKAKKEAAAKKAHRDSIMNMAVPHEWNDSMKISKFDLKNDRNFFGDELRDKMYRNLELGKDSLAEKTLSDSSVVKVTNEQMIKRIRQQVSFKYEFKTDEQGNPILDKNGKPESQVRQAYIVAQDVIQILSRPCDGQEFNPEDLNKSDLQFLFDTPIPVGDRNVVNSRWIDNGCGEEGKIHATVRQTKEEVKEEKEVKEEENNIPDGNDNTQEEDLKLGTAPSDYEEVNKKKIKSVELTKRNTSTNSKGEITAITDTGPATVGEAFGAGKKAASNTSGVYASENNTQTNAENTSDFQLGVAGSEAKADSASTATSAPDFQLGVAGGNASGGATTLTMQNVSTDGKGNVTAVTKVGETTTDEAVKTGENAASNTSGVYTNATSTATTPTYADSTATSNDSFKNIQLGVAGAVQADTTEVAADNVKNVQANSTFTSDINNDFALEVDTVGWNILRPEKDSIPNGTPAAWGEISGRGGVNFSSVSAEQNKQLEDYYGEFLETAEANLEAAPQNFAKGGAFEGETPRETLVMLMYAMKWSAKRNGDFAKFRKEVLSVMNFVKGCKESFTTEEITGIRNLFAAIHENGTIDNVIGRNNVQNTSYTVGKDCDEKGKANFATTNNYGPTNPSGPYFEQVYMAPITKPTLMLGTAFNYTYEEVDMTEIKPVDLYKRHVSTTSNSTITGITNKGSATVGAAIATGENAANNTSNVYVNEEKADKAKQKSAKSDNNSQKQKRDLQYWKNVIDSERAPH